MKKPIPFGKYYLLERMNVGGMAEVFRAKAYGVEGFERLVAVKRILPNIAEDKEFIRMFIDEAKIAVQLNHANIAQIFDLGVVDDAYYIALEHVHGRDLRAIFDRCRNGGEPMPIAQACFVIMKVCEGLDYAHNKRDQSGRELNLVHRDVSPQNVLVSFEGEVKLIDFGIAKAAGKGSKTQAGILKGKFGYMSPEQVRGLPIDRRSDVFSCGIVLYELLTGERLFVGESDFSTLEKVRNVEILPPSTYNRRIPDELERIVLKALAKDVEDRYSNAIDLHDELQAFVYTAGEFYSRKDLAGWMKRTFTREIEDETAKLEAYRQIAPPESLRSPSAPKIRAQPLPPSNGPRRSTLAMGQVSPTTSPPPPPIPQNGRRTSEQRAVAAPDDAPAMAASAVGAGNGSAAPATVSRSRKSRDPDLDWDDDELETSIYDGPDGEKPAAAAAPGRAASLPASSGASSGQMTLPGHGPARGPEPDLLNLVNTGRDWNESPRAEEGPVVALALADGSSEKRSPYNGNGHMHGHDPNEPSALAKFTHMPGQAPIYDSAYAVTYGRSAGGRSKSSVIAALAAVVLLLAGGGLAIFFIAKRGGETDAVAAASGTEASAAAAEPAASIADKPAEPERGAVAPAPADVAKPAVVDPATGFDLIIDPAGTPVKLDGKAIGKAPLQIRNLAEGDHLVEIEAPVGFFNKAQTVKVLRGQADRVEISLDAMEITGKFTSEPTGAKVTLVSGGNRVVLGKTPIQARLDPRQRYEATFKLDGHVTLTKPIELGPGSEVPVAVVLERASPEVAAAADDDDEEAATAPVTAAAAAVPAPAPAPAAPKATPKRERKPPKREVKEAAPPKEIVATDPKPAAAAAKVEEEDVDEPPPAPEPEEGNPADYGTLALGAKPPCKIYIDGRNTGKKTPQRAIRLKAGIHKITLVNNEFGIKETFTVKIKAGETTKAIKDMADQIQ